MLAPRGFGSVKIIWRDKQAKTEAERKLLRKMTEAGHALVRIIKANISTPGPPHSRPGEYPHRISGRLQSSIQLRIIGMDVQITAKTPYTKWLQKTRPFLRRSLNENRAQLKHIIETTRSLGDIMRG